MSGYYWTMDGRHLFRLLDGERTNGYSGPYVAIDPEDREAVERLVSLASHNSCIGIESWQAALREYANPKPPRPDEPQGLGAVVEDEGGARYTRVTGDDAAPWVKVPVDDWQVNCFEWDEFAAVRVLSPGVEVSS